MTNKTKDKLIEVAAGFIAALLLGIVVGSMTGCDSTAEPCNSVSVTSFTGSGERLRHPHKKASWSAHPFFGSLTKEEGRYLYAEDEGGAVLGDVFKISENTEWATCLGDGSCLSDTVGLENAKKRIEDYWSETK
jgi:hypothetical protein